MKKQLNVKLSSLLRDKTLKMILLEKGDLIPIDAEVTEGIAMVDESISVNLPVI